MKDASLFQLGIGLETGAQEEDTARGFTAANDDTILPRDVLDDSRDDHFIRRDGAVFAGTHLIIEVVNGHGLDDVARIQQAFRDCVDTCGENLCG
jgi:S-adenosylmethionine decarboxylase